MINPRRRGRNTGCPPQAAAGLAGNSYLSITWSNIFYLNISYRKVLGMAERLRAGTALGPLCLGYRGHIFSSGEVNTTCPWDKAENMWHCSGAVDRVTRDAWIWPGNLQNVSSIEIAALGAQGISRC